MGCLLGILVEARFMVLGTILGTVLGVLAYSVTPQGRWLKFPKSNFIQYLCAKGLAVIVAVAMMGIAVEGFVFDINDLYDYQKQFKSEPLTVCSTNDAKTYMDYRMTNLVDSRQYQFLRYECTVDKNTGFLYDKDGFIAVALGSYYGVIGDRFYFTLDSGVVLPLVKGEEKADVDTDWEGCYHTLDGSVIEFVIDDDYAGAFFGTNSNGYVLDGNYNNYSLFNGGIAKVEKVLEEIDRQLGN